MNRGFLLQLTHLGLVVRYGDKDLDCLGNGLSPIWFQAIIWAKADSLSMIPLAINFIQVNSSGNVICEI